MTVEELIHELEKYNPKAKVETYDSDYGPVSICAIHKEDKETICLEWE